MKMKKLLSKGLALGLFVFLSACSHAAFNNAHSMYKNQKFASAIEQYDKFIGHSDNGAKIIEAELERSDCFHQLGLLSIEKENWPLAIRFLYLSNSDVSDEILDDCYYELIKNARKKNDLATVLKHYDYIINNLKTSSLIPQILFDRIKIHYTIKQKNEHAWEDYIRLYKMFPDSEYLPQAQYHIDKFIDQYIDDAILMKDYFSPPDAIGRLSELNKYPSKANARISKEIAAIYFELAEKLINARKYEKAEVNYKKALIHNPLLADSINKRLTGICTAFINKGDDELRARKITTALNWYKQCYTVIKDYAPASTAIEKANQLENEIKLSQEKITTAQKYEKNSEFAKALTLYKESYAHNPTPRVKNKIFIVKNMLGIEKDPVAFAKQVVKNYQNGHLQKTIDAFIAKEVAIYGAEDVESGGWKVLFTIGKNKYEVRYDIKTPDKMWFFVWQVDLRLQKVTPLNKNTEKIFGE